MKEWYEISAKGEKRAEITIYDQIGKDYLGNESAVSAKKFIKDVKSLGEVDTINLFINSPGGSVFEGNTIYNYLKGHKARINVKVMGLAASIASVVAMAGNYIEMPENAVMMIHDPSGAVIGSADDMRKMAIALDKLKTGMVSIYDGRSNMGIDVVSNMMSDETWFTAEEAVEYGLADKLTEAVIIQANFENLKNYKNVPAEFLENIGNNSGQTFTPVNQDQNRLKRNSKMDKIQNGPKTFGDAMTFVINEAAEQGVSLDPDQGIAETQKKFPELYERYINEVLEGDYRE